MIDRRISEPSAITTRGWYKLVRFLFFDGIRMMEVKVITWRYYREGVETFGELKRWWYFQIGVNVTIVICLGGGLCFFMFFFFHGRVRRGMVAGVYRTTANKPVLVMLVAAIWTGSCSQSVVWSAKVWEVGTRWTPTIVINGVISPLELAEKMGFTGVISPL